MTDLSLTIAPKSDQLSADDLISGPRTITITRVTGNEGNSEQPINVYFEGDNGKPWRPCKTMRRLLVLVWGKLGTTYPGRCLTLFRDEKVQWGGLEVGGVRVSHMSHIDKETSVPLMVTRGAKKPYVVKPLKTEADTGIAAAREAIANAATLDALKTVWSSRAMAPFRDRLQSELDDRKAALAFEPEGPADTQRGDAFTDPAAAHLSGLRPSDAPEADAFAGGE